MNVLNDAQASLLKKIASETELYEIKKEEFATAYRLQEMNLIFVTREYARVTFEGRKTVARMVT